MGKPSSFHFQILALLAIFFLLGFAFATSSSESEPFGEQEQDRVWRLPGQNFNVEFAHYAGYVTVNEEAGRALFYWFIEAETNPQSKPIVLWLQGGPGCSSIGFGETEEFGPFFIQPDGKTLYLNPYSWNKVANLLFVDSPVGVGFSYSNTSSDILKNGDKRTAKDSLEFLLKWFERFPQYKGTEFYITGESYAGHFVPQLSQVIVKHNQQKAKEAINLKGYMVGNALTDDHYDGLGIFQFQWSNGMISDQTYQQMKLLCDHESLLFPQGSCKKILEIRDKEIGNIDQYSIFTPPCTTNVSLTNQPAKRKHIIGGLGKAYDPCTQKHSTIYFNLPEVQKALHVDPNHKPAQWEPCSDLVLENYQDFPLTVLDIYRELIPLGQRIWMFSGNTDGMLPVTATRYSIDALNLTTISPWRAWYDDGQVGGWTQEYDGLTFVVVRGAGHEVPLHRPKLALALIKAFLAGSSMPSLQLPSAS